MRKTQIQEISTKTASLAASATNLLTYFNGSAESGGIVFDVTRQFPGTDVSYSDCLSRLTIIAEIAEKFEKSKNINLVPLPRISLLLKAIDQTQQHLNSLSSQFRQAVEQGGGAQGFNYDNFHLQTVNGRNYDFRTAFKNFSDSIENLLEAFFGVLVILRPSQATYSFQAAANALTRLVEDFSEQLQNLREENAELEEAVLGAKASEEKAKSAAEEAARQSDEAAKERKTLAEYTADATEKKASIDSIYSAAKTLESEISEYQEKFDAFDRQLSHRNEDFEKGKEKQEELFSRFENQEQEIRRLIEQSEQMLKGATVAGLASSFSDAHRKLGVQLFWARLSFYFGILFLFVSAIPLMAYVFLPVAAPFLQDNFPEVSNAVAALGASEPVTGWQYVGQVLARFVILVPAAWFVSFAAVRHSALFKLREHYGYKYSMAMAVDGFRKQAEGYENEIAALVLEQLAFNPADKILPSKEIKEGKAPHPILDLLVGILRDRTKKDSP